jgi:hypothetical protein
MATKDDVDMVDATAKAQDLSDYADLLQTNHSDAFAFSETEQLALDLYDQLRELELQHGLLQAQQTSTVESPSFVLSGTNGMQRMCLTFRRSQMMSSKSS